MGFLKLKKPKSINFIVIRRYKVKHSQKGREGGSDLSELRCG